MSDSAEAFVVRMGKSAQTPQQGSARVVRDVNCFYEIEERRTAVPRAP